MALDVLDFYDRALEIRK